MESDIFQLKLRHHSIRKHAPKLQVFYYFSISVRTSGGSSESDLLVSDFVLGIDSETNSVAGINADSGADSKAYSGVYF